MSQQIDAIYDGGVLKPLVPLSLPDQARVKLTVEAQTPAGSADSAGVEAGFDAALEPLLFDGPNLSDDFSRRHLCRSRLMQYLVDTGVWLRLFDRTDPGHAVIRGALRSLRSGGHSLVACPQNIAEFWNVSTRPASARGGYEKSVATTEGRVQIIERFGTILAESADACDG